MSQLVEPAMPPDPSPRITSMDTTVTRDDDPPTPTAAARTGPPHNDPRLDIGGVGAGGTLPLALRASGPSSAGGFAAEWGGADRGGLRGRQVSMQFRFRGQDNGNTSGAEEGGEGFGGDAGDAGSALAMDQSP